MNLIKKVIIHGRWFDIIIYVMLISCHNYIIYAMSCEHAQFFKAHHLRL